MSFLFLRHHIKLFRCPVYFWVPLLISVYLPLSITILLPVDYVGHHTDVKYSGVTDKAILYMWKSNYWTTFLLTWLLLPVLQDFFSTGYYSKSKKLRLALRRNAKFQLIVAGVAIASAVYLMLEVGLSFGNLKSLIIALSHIYALIMALWLMAHGLVAFPRAKWTEGNLMHHLNLLYLRVPRLVDALEDTKISFKEEALQVLVLEKNYAIPAAEDTFVYRDWILSLSKEIPDHLRESTTRLYVYNEERNISRDQVTESFMSLLAQNFQSHLWKLNAYTSEYEILLRQIERLQYLLEAKSAEPGYLRNEVMSRFPSPLPPNVNYYYQCYVRPAVARVYSLVLFAGSFVVIQSEFFHSTKLSLINLLVYHTGVLKRPGLMSFVTFIVFVYMLFCLLNSLTRLKIFNMYHLVPHNSDPVSASFYCSYIARLTIPLSYNFIGLFVSRESVFEEWYGKSIHLTGLFNLLNDWVPRLVLIPVVLTTFNLYDRIKQKLGFADLYGSWADFDDEDDVGETSNLDIESNQNKRLDLIIVEAKRMVAMELNRRKQQATRTQNYDVRVLPADTQSNRIDYNDQEDGETQSGVWSRLNRAVTGFKDSIQSRFIQAPQYRDNPLDEYEYDEDANERLVL